MNCGWPSAPAHDPFSPRGGSSGVHATRRAPTLLCRRSGFSLSTPNRLPALVERRRPKGPALHGAKVNNAMRAAPVGHQGLAVATKRSGRFSVAASFGAAAELHRHGADGPNPRG